MMENNEIKEEAKGGETSCCTGASFCTPRNRMIVGGVVLALILGGAVYMKKKDPDFLKLPMDRKMAQEKVLKFVNEKMLQPGMQAEATAFAVESGLYKITLKVGEQEIPTYVTKDGKLFFPQGINIEEVDKKENDQKAAAESQTAQKEITKSDRPIVDLYVMSFCPFGNKAEDTMKSVYALLKNKVTFNFHYIVSTEGDAIKSLHGDKEVAQNEREACVLKNYGKDRWMDFVTYVNTNCGSDGACWEAGAKTLGINAAGVNACVASQGATLMKAEEKASQAASASGSPTLLINGTSSSVAYQYGNSEAYKQAICGAFNKAPAECAKTLEAKASDPAAAGSCATPQ